MTSKPTPKSKAKPKAEPKAKPEPKPFTVKIDADVLARINAKIAKAHEQTDSPYVYQRPKTVVKPAIHDSEPVAEDEPEPIINDDAETDI